MNITQYVHIFEDASYLYLALGWCDGGNVGDTTETASYKDCDKTCTPRTKHT